MPDREKLIELVHDARMNAMWHNAPKPSEYIADMLISNGVVVREKGEWEPILDRRGNHREEEIYASVWRCPVCGEEDFYSNFCPNCGADMRAEEQNRAREGENDG